LFFPKVPLHESGGGVQFSKSFGVDHLSFSQQNDPLGVLETG
jgi:hypothetical protein